MSYFFSQILYLMLDVLCPFDKQFFERSGNFDIQLIVGGRTREHLLSALLWNPRSSSDGEWPVPGGRKNLGQVHSLKN